MSFPFHFLRLAAIIRKEFVQMRRDRLTFGMMAGIPMIQLVLFGFAINQDPKHLPAGMCSTNCSRPRASSSAACAGVRSVRTR